MWFCGHFTDIAIRKSPRGHDADIYFRIKLLTFLKRKNSGNHWFFNDFRFFLGMRHGGVEPPTTWLKVKCSTNWASIPFKINIPFLSGIYSLTTTNRVPGSGIEPETRGFSVLCSTNWANWASHRNLFYRKAIRMSRKKFCKNLKFLKNKHKRSFREKGYMLKYSTVSSFWKEEAQAGYCAERGFTCTRN